MDPSTSSRSRNVAHWVASCAFSIGSCRSPEGAVPSELRRANRAALPRPAPRRSAHRRLQGCDRIDTARQAGLTGSSPVPPTVGEPACAPCFVFQRVTPREPWPQNGRTGRRRRRLAGMVVTVDAEFEQRIAELIAARRPLLEQPVRQAVDAGLMALVDAELGRLASPNRHGVTTTPRRGAPAACTATHPRPDPLAVVPARPRDVRRTRGF